MSMWRHERPPRKGNYLGGSFFKLPDVDGYTQSVNPGNTRDLIGQYAYSLSAVDVAVDHAVSVRSRWHRTALGNRKVLLERFAQGLTSLKDAFIHMIVREVGKPVWEAELEFKAAIRFIELTCEQGPQSLEPLHIPELDAMTEQHPWGVTAIPGAFDRPLLSPITLMVPALLAGNTVVFKPSRYTPTVGQLIAESIDRSKFPRGVFNMVQGRGRQVGERLITHGDVNAVLMEGALPTAKRIQRLLADQPWKHLSCRACSRGTAIVLDDAEVDKAIYELLIGAYLTTGQRRSSTSRVLVTSGISDRFIQRMVAVTNRIGIGQGFEPGVFLGPLVGKRIRRRFLEFLQRSVNEGMDLLTPSYSVEYHLPGYYVHPAILYGSPLHIDRPQTAEDILGPVLEVYVVKDFEEAVDFHNRSPSTQATSLFTRTVDYLHEARFRLRSQLLNFNCSTIHMSTRLPLPALERAPRFTGLSQSVRGSARSVTLYQDRKPFDPQALLPGITWPDAPIHEEDDDDDEDEVTLIIDPDTTIELPIPSQSDLRKALDRGASVGSGGTLNLKDEPIGVAGTEGLPPPEEVRRPSPYFEEDGASMGGLGGSDDDDDDDALGDR